MTEVAVVKCTTVLKMLDTSVSRTLITDVTVCKEVTVFVTGTCVVWVIVCTWVCVCTAPPPPPRIPPRAFVTTLSKVLTSVTTT